MKIQIPMQERLRTQKKHKTAFLLDSKESSESSSEEEQVNCLEKVVLYTSKQEEISKFTQEALNSAALDTCCSANVAGEKWMSIYIDSLPEEMRNNVIVDSLINPLNSRDSGTRKKKMTSFRKMKVVFADELAYWFC